IGVGRGGSAFFRSQAARIARQRQATRGSAAYDALVRMAQDSSMRYPLEDGQGNWGSVDGDPPAAMRYTEVRMSRIASELMQDIDKETVDWTPNYDEKELEPTVLLPARAQPARRSKSGSTGI